MKSAKKSLIKTIIIVTIVGGLLILITSLSMVYAKYDIFSTGVSQGKQMNIPFTIFIEILATAAGVILGLQFENFAEEKRRWKDYNNLFERIDTFITNLYEGIWEKKKNIFELSEYKMHWELLLGSDAFAVQTLQNETEYFELAYIFNFLIYNRHFWLDYSDKSIEEIIQSPTADKAFIAGLNEWRDKVKNVYDTKIRRHEMAT